MSHRSQTRRYDGRGRGRGGHDPFRDEWRRFAAFWAKALAGLAMRRIVIESEGAHEDQFGAFAAALGGPRMVFVFRSQTLHAPGLMVFSPRASELLIQLMHGGGVAPKTHPRAYEDAPRGLGAALLRRLAQGALDVMETGLFDGEPLALKLTRHEVGIDMAPIVRDEDRVVRSRFRLEDGAASGVVDLIFPAACLAILSEEKKRRAEAEQNAGPGAASREALTRALSSAFVEIAAELGATELSLRDILALRPGQEISLAGEPSLAVEGRAKYRVELEPGVEGRPRRIRIV